MKIFLVLFIIGYCFAQDTKLTTSSTLTSKPDDKSSIGKLNTGTKVRKLKLDPSGKYVKVAFEAYVPVAALENGTVSLPVGSTQSADGIKFKLISARQKGKQVFVKVKVTNTNSKKFNFTGLSLIKISGSGNNIGEMNPFEGNNTVAFDIRKGKSITSDMVFDFKTPPNNVELICMSKMKNSEKIYFQLGF